MVESSFQVERRSNEQGAVLLELRGDCLLVDGSRVWAVVDQELQAGQGFTLDLSGVLRLDGASAALLQALRLKAERKGISVELQGASTDQQRMLDLYDCTREGAGARTTPANLKVLDQIGRATMESLSSIKDVLAFVGDLAHSIRLSFRDRSSINWKAVPGLMERAGADGVPITLLINFLVGLIVALQASYQLQKFGASIFIADLVGLSMVREMAPLMTAIVVAGRSGAAYAAELGTMKVNQEVDALWTLGFDPQRFLVIPRLIALTSVVPLLTIFSMLVGIFGGLLVAVQRLNLTTLAYFVELEKALSLSDVMGGVIKSVVFAVTITFISCQRGLGTHGGAAGVGRSTTSAVVVILFFLVVLDAMFTVFFNIFGI